MKNILLVLLFALVLSSCGNDNDTKADLKSEFEYAESTNDKPTKPAKAVEVEEESPYKLGVDYELLKEPYDTGTKSEVVVYEFFGYTCPHCFYFEPFIQKWLSRKSNKIKFVRVPLNFQRGWEVMQKGYLTAKMMGIANQTHSLLFEELHNNHKRFNTIDELAQWYADNTDVTKEAFLSTADSFILDSKQRQADKMGFKMGVTGTPALVINGKYTISKKIRDRDEILRITNYLARQEMKKMGLVD